jgi:hypothetical protein
MAEFSKQWCEKNDPNMSWDFDILDEADKLKPNHYISYICEGFGFAGIAKDKEGNILLGFSDYDIDRTEWKTYKEVIDGSI